MDKRKVRRGDIYYADLPKEEKGSVQAGRRPVLITQCDRLNRTSTCGTAYNERSAKTVNGRGRTAKDYIKITAAGISMQFGSSDNEEGYKGTS